MTGTQKNILVIGGGFGGISTALTLSKFSKEHKITLISDKPHHEYHPGLYRIITGRSPIEICLPVDKIVSEKGIRFIKDKVTHIDAYGKKVKTFEKKILSFDYLVIALGSETAYYDIPGLQEFTHSFNSVNEAIKLRDHIQYIFEEAYRNKKKDGELSTLLSFVVVGAGPNGVEASSEIAYFSDKLAKNYKVNPEFVVVELIEAGPRILPTFPKSVSDRVEKRLRELGINIYTNRPMLSSDLEEIKVRGLTLKTGTVIWSAGVKANRLCECTKGFKFDKRGKVIVDKYLRAKDFANIYVIGDSAGTKYSGMAQTAIDNGNLAAKNILSEIYDKPLKIDTPKMPYYAIPIGEGWAAAILGPIHLYGKLGWFLRRIADFRYYISILPFRKALHAFSRNNSLCEACPICTPELFPHNVNS